MTATQLFILCSSYTFYWSSLSISQRNANNVLLLSYADGSQQDEFVAMQLVKGSVEEVKLKGHDLCLKLISTIGGEKQIYLSFSDAKLYNRWLRRCKKVSKVV